MWTFRSKSQSGHYPGSWKKSTSQEQNKTPPVNKPISQRRKQASVKRPFLQEDKFILDPTCSSKSIWFNKNHPNAIYTDIRKEGKGFIPVRPNFVIDPDLVADFRDLPFPDRCFKLITWDPPHLRNLDKQSWIYKKYGSLGPQWKEDLLKGFNELWRVLDNFGVLILKWSRSHDNRPNRDITTSELLKLLPVQPLFGHPSGSKSNTIWMCFMKIPENINTVQKEVKQ